MMTQGMPLLIISCKCGANIPAGYRFIPTDQELMEILEMKLRGEMPPFYPINEANVYSNHPNEIVETFKSSGEYDWYFFTLRNRKYKRGSRPNRSAAVGYWKATDGCENVVDANEKILGVKKTLVYFEGKPPGGRITDWIINEYAIEKTEPVSTDENNSMKMDWILCRIYDKNNVRPCYPSSEDELEGYTEDEDLTASSSEEMNEDVASGQEEMDNIIDNPLQKSDNLDPTVSNDED